MVSVFVVEEGGVGGDTDEVGSARPPNCFVEAAEAVVSSRSRVGAEFSTAEFWS